MQGACLEDLRRESTGELTRLPFDGFAIGGLAVGESKELRESFTELTSDLPGRYPHNTLPQSPVPATSRRGATRRRDPLESSVHLSDPCVAIIDLFLAFPDMGV